MLKLTLGTDSDARKNIPIFSGCIAYFCAALAGVARHSKRGNDKHNPGQALHHARGKSMDHPDCVPRHSMDMGDMIAYLERNESREGHDKKVVALLLEEADALCWRSLAWSQELYEKYGGAPLAPAARLPVLAPPVVNHEHPTISLSGVDSRMKCNLPGCESDRASNSSFCKVHRPPSV